jgi:peptidoglycan L-alanyl-D-glutamate endopeptidase CwlK
MASRSLMDLTAEMEDKAHDVDDTCKRQGVDLLFYCTLRPLRDQAYWWRWSRKRSEIDDKIEEFQFAGYDRLASAVLDVGPVNGIVGAHKTHACAGESWHQFGEAFDAVPLRAGKPAWGDNDLWQVYGAVCREHGLTWGGDFRSLNDSPHAQLRATGNPLTIWTPNNVNDALDRLIFFDEEDVYV